MFCGLFYEFTLLLLTIVIIIMNYKLVTQYSKTLLVFR
jgi:hypothetical protein